MTDLDEQAAAAAAAAEAGNLIHLVDPNYASLTFGPDSASAIVFGPKGGFEEGHWRGPRDHPLIPELLRLHPQISEERTGPTTLYSCVECEMTFGTAAGARAHARKSHAAAVK